MKFNVTSVFPFFFPSIFAYPIYHSTINTIDPIIFEVFVSPFPSLRVGTWTLLITRYCIRDTLTSAVSSTNSGSILTFACPSHVVVVVVVVFFFLSSGGWGKIKLYE